MNVSSLFKTLQYITSKCWEFITEDWDSPPDEHTLVDMYS